MSKDRLYTIDTFDTHRIFAGRIDNGSKQALIVDSQIRQIIIVVLFDIAGNMIEVRENSYALEGDKSASELRKYQDATLAKVIQEVALNDSDYIRVKKFWVDGHMIGIHNFPSNLQYLLEEPEFTAEQLKFMGYTSERLLETPTNKENHRQYIESLESWKKSTNFVFWGGRGAGIGADYWANDNGIHST